MRNIFLFALLSCLCYGLDACQQRDAVQPAPACLKDRANTDTLQNVRGTVAIDGDLRLILVAGTGEPLAPCNLPDNLQHEDEVIFSGYKKEIFPNERWAGQPFVLTEIALADG